MTVSLPGQPDLDRAAEALAARLPAQLHVLTRLAFNYRWSWIPGGRELFMGLDPRRWQVCRENPVRLLQELSAEGLAKAVNDSALLARASTMERAVREELDRPPANGNPDRPIAFLCAEFGIHRSLPIYSGGLGVLAGDILKEASDRALPLVGVGLLYRLGYFHQQLDSSGWQLEYWIETDPERLPAALVTGHDGAPIMVEVQVNGRAVRAQIWRVAVGRTALYLLDTDCPENSAVDRWISSRLYVGDRGLRLAQYTVLGIGGIRALRALGIEPGIVHLNEGHAAMAPLELAREQMSAGRSFEEALEAARERTVFTTHTPVAAGNEAFSSEEFAGVARMLAEELAVDTETVLRLGRTQPADASEPFGLTPLGLRVSRSANAVSRLHGRTARAMWQPLYAGHETDDVPISHVTNGVHLPTWMAPAMRELLDRYLGEGWVERAAEPGTWDPVDSIPDEDLWAVRCRLREDLVGYVRDKSVTDRLARGEPMEYVQSAARGFSPDVLTVGFARRAAAYKRWYLWLQDRDRALGLLAGPARIQMVLAGKSHPLDEEAKRILQGVFTLKLESTVGERLAFLEDYDMTMAARMVAGCDLWLNVPRYPMEASGTSGMKAVLNGGLNLSVLDGWWEEAYDGGNGWAIRSDPSPGPAEQDARDASALYDVLEREIQPAFADRDADGIPRGWIRRVKQSLRTIGPHFCATRMLSDYVAGSYAAPVR
jgi:starch phosphorylase